VKAYLLAAGKGQRAGGPKAWMLREGKTLLERQIEFLLTRCKPQDIYVSVQEVWLERCRAINADVNWVTVDPEGTAFGSLRRLSASASHAWATLHHVDMPVWETSLFAALSARAVTACGSDAVVPVHDGQRGHPVILSPRLQRRLAAADPLTGRLDVILRESRVEELPVPFSCIHENWNEPAPR
jgi:CTP:molybdopterin cytidylyltransferase MocA